MINGCTCFKCYGMFLCNGYPSDSNGIPDEAFVPSLVTEQEHDKKKLLDNLTFLTKEQTQENCCEKGNAVIHVHTVTTTAHILRRE
jgi:hypothetical protein